MSTPVLILALIATSTSTPSTASSTASATWVEEAPPAPSLDEVYPEDDLSSRARQILSSVDVHAFVSQGYFRTSSNDYLGASSDGSCCWGSFFQSSSTASGTPVVDCQGTAGSADVHQNGTICR